MIRLRDLLPDAQAPADVAAREALMHEDAARFGTDYIVFPNPTEDILNIKTQAFENVMYSLYDAQGKLVIQNKLSAAQTLIQVSHLAAGSYSLILNNKS